MLASIALVLGAALSVSSHYTFPKAASGGSAGADWQYVRKADNWQNNGFVGSVGSEQIRCFQANSAGAPSTIEVAAGGTVTYSAAPNVYHPGPMSFYLARVPDGESVNTWKGDGAVWFKIYQEQPNFGQQLTWPSNGKSSFPVTIPRCIKAGNYLLRVEHIGLHAASTSGGAQFYISCAQLKVTGGGSTEPSEKVSFPGAYKASDPGILININYPVPTSYKNPGPSVFSC
ncbi:glycosyl hydrolase family 61-domain-containing protein [Echria macrotheca]|uniref:lytic cellulose monooxygenase (C4-dehydrogenating) n=1 Tax=Echria macrotheca TaxID=438768 RepID=A0AAJ0BNF1_9PEZI|nr:glycosyl hydrolase family 61-domain-containing protein [Echria macrotheca]